MMYLHDNETLFSSALLDVSAALGISDSIVEKDYYVFLMLKYIVNKLGSDVVFKGGTSLSKAYRIITRFSEDIDLCLPQEKIKSDGARKRLVEAVLSGFEENRLSNITERQIQRRGDYNNLIGAYKTCASNVIVQPTIKVEVAHRIREFPYQQESISSYIGDYLFRKSGSYGSYALEPFTVLTVSFYRTFIDKLFAIGDYYLSGKTKRYSRHLYDIYKISSVINWADISLLYNLRNLMFNVRNERKTQRKCKSAQDDVVLRDILYQAMISDFYRDDYNSLTSVILFESVSYDLCKSTILQLLGTQLFA